MANCRPQSLAASKGRALICEGTAFRATQVKGRFSLQEAVRETKNWPDEIESLSGANNPKGIATSSPRLRGTSYLGKTSKQNDNRNAVAAMSRGSCSVPNVFFIPFDFVLAQKHAQLILKTHLTMLLLLIGDVLLH